MMMLEEIQKEKLVNIIGDNVQFNEELSSCSTIKIGGDCSALVKPCNIESLKELIAYLVEQKVAYYTLGAGSNTLIRDGGIDGVVIILKQGFNELKVLSSSEKEVLILAGAGVHTMTLVKFAIENGFSGVEGLAGIPGTVGGNIVTNAGTREGSMADCIEEITTVDRQGRELTVKKKALDFSYRNLKMPRSTIITQAVLKLQKEDSGQVQAKVDALLEKRKKTQPWNVLTLGCVFKNPITKKSGKAVSITSAGRLIEEAELKGVRVGRARISEIHSNFIINEGGASSKDVEILTNLIKEKVKQKFAITLEQEIKIIGKYI